MLFSMKRNGGIETNPVSCGQAATPTHMRRVNEKRLLECLTRLRTASRATLAKAAGLSQPTAGKIIHHFLELGILREIGTDAERGSRKKGKTTQKKLGRPGRLLEFDAKTPRFIGVHLDVRETALTMLPFSPFVQPDWSIRFPTTNSPQSWLEQLLQHRPKRTPHSIWAVAISVPGIVDEAAGKVLFSPNLHWTERTDLIGLLKKVWRLPVYLVQEIRALALGHLKTEGEGEDFLLVDVGEGLGGAIVLNGGLYPNSLPLSGELGHTPVPGNPRPCGCGGTGCLETLLSRRGLLQSFAIANDRKKVDWPELVAALKGKELPPWLISTLDAAGTVIAGALNILGIRKVVVTGCINDLPDAVHEVLFSAIRRGAMWARFGEILYQPAPRRRAAGLIAVCMDKWLENNQR